MVAFAGYPLVVKDRIDGGRCPVLRRPLSQVTLEAMASVADEIALGIEQVRANEARLRDSRARFQAIVNTAIDAIVSIDREGTVLSFNPAAERIFGFTTQEILGRNVTKLMPSPHREEHDEYITRYLETGNRALSVEPRGSGKEEGRHGLPARDRRQRARHGQRPDLRGHPSGYHQRKAAEEEIRELNASLERRVAERTAEFSSWPRSSTRRPTRWRSDARRRHLWENRAYRDAVGRLVGSEPLEVARVSPGRVGGEDPPRGLPGASATGTGKARRKC